MDTIRPYLDQNPRLGQRVYIDESARVIGEVVLGDDVSVWPLTVIRGDVNFVRIGDRTNVQDGTVIHVSHDGPHAKLGGFATVIGADCTIGHKAMLHGCLIGEGTLIGMGATVLNGAKIGRGCLIGAGALITEGKEIPDGSLVMGAPGKVVRALDEEAQVRLLKSAEHYRANAARYARGLKALG